MVFEPTSQSNVSFNMSGVMWKVVLFAAFTAFIAALIAWYTRETFDPKSLRGKKVVICGASTGIGEELAYQYAKFGAQVLLVARREEELQKVVSKCGKLGAESANYIVADLSSLEGARYLAAVSTNSLSFQCSGMVSIWIPSHPVACICSRRDILSRD